LSSIFLTPGSFSLSLLIRDQYHASEPTRSMARNPQLERAFTLIEIIVVLTIIVIMMAMVYPAYTTISERAKAIKDMSNLRQIGLAMQMYLNDKDGILPAIDADPGVGKIANPVIYPKYIDKGGRRVFQSPFDKRPVLDTDSAPVSYGINENMYLLINGNMTKVVSPSSTIFVAPKYNGDPTLITAWTNRAAAAPYVRNLPVGGGGVMTRGPQRNGTQINALFCDFHAETMTFGPATVPGTFRDTATHWDPTQ
jgi:prepilin-type N-terminal cleavage/methylation domain-containing protein/prepilin-type processing-associated H-X9-DG protein